MNLLAQHPGPPLDALGVGLGIAAILLVAGGTATRWHRDRLRFTLMQAALEKGLTRFPGTPPYWLLSLRQGVTMLALGIGLAVAGGAAWWLGKQVPLPPTPANAQLIRPAPGGDDPNDPRASRPGRREERADFPPPRPDESRRGPSGERADFPSPRPDDARRLPSPDRADRSGSRGPDRMEDAPPRREPPDPEIDHWRRAQVQQSIGLVSVAAGFILMLTALVRIGFARIEQRLTNESETPLY